VWLGGGVAAVDGEWDADHEAGCGAAKPEYRGGDLVELADWAARNIAAPR
jgi:hypothetical protein